MNIRQHKSLGALAYRDVGGGVMIVKVCYDDISMDLKQCNYACYFYSVMNMSIYLLYLYIRIYSKHM